MLITVETGPQPADSADIRAANSALVMRYVRTNGPCSRADIAATTGLNKASVSNIVADLIDRRLLREIGTTENRIGRPATMLVPDGQPYATIGIEVGTHELTTLAVDLSGTRLLSWRRAFAGVTIPPGRAAAIIAALASQAVTHVSRVGRQILALTVGVPGIVDATGTVRLCPSLGWQDLGLRDHLITLLHRPAYHIVVDSDANLAAQAERRYGTYTRFANVIFVTGGARIAASVIADGRQLRGSQGLTAQLAHLPVNADGPACTCGHRGCLQTAAAIPALVRRALPETQQDAPRADLGPDVDEIARRARLKEPTTIAALADTGRWLGYGLSIMANIMNPELIVIGGHYATIAKWLLPHAEAQLQEHYLLKHASGCRIMPARLTHQPVALGSAAWMLNHIEAGHVPLPQLADPGQPA